MTPEKLATVALEVMAGATIPATDEAIELARAARGMLTAIARGLMHVVPAVPQEKPE